MKLISLLLLLTFLFLTVSSQKQENLLNIHVVPHTHNDVGWLETVRQYYDNCVKHILNSVVKILKKDKTTKFVWVETQWIDYWWKEASPQDQKTLRELIQEKRFEFILGAWCMNDEATPTYSAIIDQVTLGHQYLHEKFNITPRYSWQLDPFGYSSAVPSLWSQIGFKNHAIVRVDFELKRIFRQAKQLQFLWQGSKSLGKKTEMFTHIFYNHYNPPHGFKWEPSYPMHPGSGNVPITNSTVQARAEVFTRAMREWASGYRTNHILYPFGDDFTFMVGHENFGNMTRLMNYINERPEIYGLKIKYSVLSEYFESLPTDIPWDVRKVEDFFPYADGDHSYWTGYFSSYPELKDVTRQGESFARNAEMLSVFSKLEMNQDVKGDWNELLPLREANAILQHHDGVTGTAKDFVRKDYFDRMHSGIDKAIKSMESSLSGIIKSQNKETIAKITHNYHTLDVTKNPNLLVYNSLAWTRNEVLKIYSKDIISKIIGPDNEDISFDIFHNCENPNFCYSVYFEIKVAPLGFSIYKFIKGQQLPKVNKVSFENDGKIRKFNHHDVYDFTFCGSHLCHLKNKRENIETNVNQDYFSYIPHDGQGSSQRSGVYIFRPKLNTPQRVDANPKTTVFEGKHVLLVSTQFGNYIQQNYTLVRKSSELSVDVRSGVLPRNHEIIFRLKTDFNNQEIFTDNNGLEMKKRNIRVHSKEPISSNYYPLVYSSYMQDGNRQFTIISNRTLGIGYLKPGEVELMFHRRTDYDDGRGVAEALQDYAVSNLGMKFIFDTKQNSEALRHKQTYQLNFPVSTFSVESTNEIQRKYNPVSFDLPRNVHLLSFQRKYENSNDVLMRFINIFEVDEHKEFSRREKIQLKLWLKRFKFLKFESTSLSGNINYGPKDPEMIDLTPIEIKTFLTSLKK